MSKRLHQTVLALSVGLLSLGTAHAQLLIDEGQPHPAATAPTSTAPVPTASVTTSPATPPPAGLLIENGYDTPKVVAVPVPASAPMPTSVTVPVSQGTVVASAVPVSVPSEVVEVGTRPAFIRAPKGWADGVPLSVALRQVVPAEYSVVSDKVDTAKAVSWSGDRPWNDVLGALARNAHVHIAILWDSKTVTVVPDTQPALVVLPAAKPVFVAIAPAHPVVVSTVPEEAVVTRPLPVAVPMVQTWRLDPNKTLRENVDAWVKQAGWNKLVWEGADYPIYGAATFVGAFDAPDGPLAKLIDGYAQSQQPLLVRLTTMDRVVHVYNKNYQPVEVESISAATLAPDILKDSGVKSTSAQNAQQGASMAPITINDRTVQH
jgi:hypothetical protein